MDNNNTVSDTDSDSSHMMTNEELITLLQTRDPKATAIFATLSPDEEDILYFAPLEIVTNPEEVDEVIVSMTFVHSEPLNDEECDDEDDECDCDEDCNICSDCKKNNYNVN